MELDAKYLITISGKSLSGKTTLGRLLEATGDFEEVKSHTTRPPRVGEAYGKDYYFVNDATFDTLEATNSLLGGTKIGDYRYGTAYETLERAIMLDKVPFAVTDPEGPKFMAPWCEDHDTTLIAIWRHVDRKRQFERWFKRTMEHPEGLNDSVERLIGMIDREPIWFDEWDWDMILMQQGREHARDMVNEVRLAAGLQPMSPEWKIPEGIFKEK